MSATICIVGGCGHVGLPLGIALCNAGARVTLVDLDRDRVRRVAAGHMPFLERGAEEALPRALASGRLRVTTTSEVISAHEAVIVTIGTPVDEFLDPSVRSFDRHLDAMLEHMVDWQLLVLRSTVFPGVTDRLVRRLADSGPNLHVAYCPERIAQGFALEELGRLPQIVGGATPEASDRAAKLFALLGARVIELPPIEAELAKLFANAYRYINFAISNQFFSIAQNFGARFDRIHEAVTADYPRMRGFAKAGFAGGPCLLKDTMQLAAFNHNAFAIGQAAMMVNEGLPCAVVDAVKSQRDLSNATAAILGMAFKGDCDDPRDSLAYKLRKVLTLQCRRVLCTDPYIDDESFVPVETALREADIVFLGACHHQYRDLVIEKPVVDVFGFLGKGSHEGSGDGRGGFHRRLSRGGTAGARLSSSRAG
jgi:UDP-N-acetyl-D-mannosaminuronic acid dehydrogenase